MKHEPWLVIRALKAFRTEHAAFEADEVYSIPRSRAEEYVRQGLAELVNVDEDEDEDGESDDPAGGPVWEDPDLGQFRHDGFGWAGRVALPAYAAFRLGRRKAADTVPLVFETDDADELPTAAAANVARQVLANQAALAPLVAEALWADFTGAGPDSGMYWHGDLDQVAEGLPSGKPPARAADLYPLLRLTEVRVRQVTRKRVRAELTFEAAFEQEHGLGVLTDGSAVVGIGYAADAAEFPRRRRPKA